MVVGEWELGILSKDHRNSSSANDTIVSTGRGISTGDTVDRLNAVVTESQEEPIDTQVDNEGTTSAELLIGSSSHEHARANGQLRSGYVRGSR